MAGRAAAIWERWLVRPESPSADLYLANACADWLAPAGPIRRLGPGVFASEATLVVVRHGGRAGRLPARRRVFWVIDDALDAMASDPGVPWAQRAKLRLVERRHRSRLLGAGAEVVASSPAIAAAYKGLAPTHLLGPHWSEPLADLAHHGEGPVRAAYLGSAVHAADLDFLRPVLAALLARHPALEIHLAANHRLGGLWDHPRLVPIRETAWPAYRRALRHRRVHLALYPLLDTPANRARSVNKIIEHAIVGAAGIYSAAWPEAARVARRGAGLVLANEPEAWIAGASALIADPARRRALAARGRALAADLNHPGPQRNFWRHGFALASSPPF